MGNLFSWVSSYFAKKEQRILFLGLDAAGKTTAMYKLKSPEETITTIPTIGINIETVKIGKAEVTFWDAGGRERIRPLFRHYFPNTQGVVLIIDSTDRDRMDEVNSDIIEKLLNDENLKHAVLLILANKQDLPNAMSVNELAERLARKRIKQEMWMIFPCCATSGDGLKEGLTWLTEQIEVRRAAGLMPDSSASASSSSTT